MRCAFCGSGLTPYLTPEKVSVEICPSCRALRLDPGELEVLLGNSALPEFVHALPTPFAPVFACGRCDHSELRENVPNGATSPQLFDCPRCASFWVRPNDFALLQRASRRPRPRAPSLVAREETRPPGGLFDRRAWESTLSSSLAAVRGRLLATLERDPAAFYLLLVFLGSWLFALTEVGAFLGSVIGMPFHEFGHALASWLNGRFAIPLPFFTFWREERSLSLTLLLLVSAGGGVWFFRKRQEFAPMVGSAVVGVLVLVAWMGLSAEGALETQILGGFLGEILLGVSPLALYFVRAPPELRWDFWRFFVVLPASASFTHALTLWTHARSDPSVLPWGSALGSDGDGDLNRLVREFGWTAEGLVTLFEGSAMLGAALVLAVLLVRLRDAVRGATTIDVSE